MQNNIVRSSSISRLPERRLTPVAAALLAAFAGAGYAPAAQPTQVDVVEFDSQFINAGRGSSIDISRYNKGNIALPGDYRAMLYVNEMRVGMTEVALREIKAGTDNVQPCFNRELLDRVGVNVARLSEEAQQKLAADSGECLMLADLVPGATAVFDNGEQRLDVGIPQALMNRQARGWIDPKYWDDGMPAAILQYNANVFHTSNDFASNTQSYLGVNAGLNAGPWRLRYLGNVTNTSGNNGFGSGGGTHVQNMQTYVQRGFAGIKSQLTLGDSYTDGSVFDSFGVRGVQLATDDRMYPESLRGYAPTVRGIANSNAKVQIRQSGNIIYETTVSPGPFEINDLYPNGYGGDLQVIVTEADGRQHVSSLPYSAPVGLLREGRWRYSAAAGQYRNTAISDDPFVFEANVQHGLNNLLTLYGGAIAAQDYQSGIVGMALNTSVGAFSLDVTQAFTSLESQSDRKGQSFRLSYSRLFAPTNTNVTLAAYRYSTSGFLGLQDAMSLRDQENRDGRNVFAPVAQKGRLQATLSQSLGKWGSLYLSGYTQNYWDRSGRDTSYQAGYNTTIAGIGVGISAARELETYTGRWSNRYMLNFSVPLGSSAHAPTSMTSYTHNTRDGSDQFQESLSGSLGTNNEFNYGVSASYTRSDTAGNTNNVSANAGYLSPLAQMRVNASRGNGYTQTGAGLSGTILAWLGGVALTSQTGDTFGVIEAKDAAGARVASAPGVWVDPFGHAVVAGVSPYAMNTVEIDTKGLPMGVQLKSTEQHYAPTAGAVVKVKFDTENRGKSIMLRVKQPGGQPVPFGADVFDDAGNNIGSVAQGGRVMAYSLKESGGLTVKWGEDAGQSCRLNYSTPKEEGKQAPFHFVESECR